MARKLIRVSRIMLFAWFMLAGFIFLFTPQNLTNKFQFAFAHLFRWPLSIGRNISLSARTRQPLTSSAGQKEYNNHITNLQIWLDQEHKKVEKLSGLSDRYPLEDVRFILADVLPASDRSASKLIINRGKNYGLRQGQFVLGDNSIIGTIANPSFRSAQVTLFTDPSSKIAVKIGTLNVRGLMQGDGNNSAKIQYLPAKHKVNVGDVVYADKKIGFLDDLMIVGKIAQCKRGAEPLLWDITVKPACDIEKLKSVAVIVMNP
jgi:rod shape-determining protein MreC